jgi:hypothetical protein
MTAQQLKRLLAERHSGDAFVPECKMGSAGSRILDGWALSATWSPLTAIGYEVKVSRSDWLQDQKYEEYRAACHLFFIVAPKGVVQRQELPDGVGLLEPVGAGTGQRLVMRVKPARQAPDAEKLVSLMAHALMWKRAEGDPRRMERTRQAAFWREFANEKAEFHSVGRNVKGRMRKLLSEAIEQRNTAVTKAKLLQEAADTLADLGVNLHSWNIRQRITEAVSQDRTRTLQAVSSAITALQSVRDLVEKVDQPQLVRVK